MNEILTIKREVLKEQLNEYITKAPEHVYILDLVPKEESTIFSLIPETPYLMDHTLYLYFDKNIELTYDKIEKLLNFIFKVKNAESRKNKRLIIACKDGRRMSGTVALWAMEWLMGEDKEDELYKKNPDLLPDEIILGKLFLHPLI